MKRTWILVFIAVFIPSVLLDFFVRTGEGHGGLLGFHMPGLFALFGLIACVAIIVISKLIGHYWLQRKEDYYNKSDGNE